MALFVNSFLRALAYCLMPRTIVLSLLPLLLTVVLTLGLGYFYWDAAVQQTGVWLEAFSFVGHLAGWLSAMGLGRLQAVLAPLLVILAVTPLLVVACLLAVATLMAPAVVHWVARRRFPQLQASGSASLLDSLAWALGSTALALVALVVSVPLWVVGPLFLVVPPLIWGWLSYRVMAYDALASHASAEERRTLFARHRVWLLGMGVFTGYLGAAPALLWASGAMFAAAFVVLVPLAVWLYTLVFAFASLWFTHFCLAALQALRAERMAGAADGALVVENP